MEVDQLTELLRRNARLIHKVAHAYCREPSGREEVVQEIAVQLWRSHASYDPSRKETTWVYRIALNVAISFQRRERRHHERRLADDVRAITITAPVQSVPSEEVELLLDCIDELSALDKALVLLHLDGNDHTSIAEVLGISVSNVGTKLARIKDRLRVALERRTQPRPTGEPHAAR